MATQSPTGGSCLCGKVKFQLTDGAFTSVVCHCINCQKVTGSAFAANAMYKRESYKVVSGEDYIKGYIDVATDSGNRLKRSFCSNCGSSLTIEKLEESGLSPVLVVMTGSIDGSKERYAPKRELFENRRYNCISVARGSGKQTLNKNITLYEIRNGSQLWTTVLRYDFEKWTVGVINNRVNPDWKLVC